MGEPSTPVVVAAGTAANPKAGNASSRRVPVASAPVSMSRMTPTGPRASTASRTDMTCFAKTKQTNPFALCPGPKELESMFGDTARTEGLRQSVYSIGAGDDTTMNMEGTTVATTMSTLASAPMDSDSGDRFTEIYRIILRRRVEEEAGRRFHYLLCVVLALLLLLAALLFYYMASQMKRHDMPDRVGDRRLLLCAFGSLYIFHVLVPPVEVCDFEYYDSFYKYDINLAERAGPLGPAKFFERGADTKKPPYPVYGASFSTDKEKFYTDLNTKDFNGNLYNLMANGNFFYGMMDIYGEELSKDRFKRALTALKLMKDYLTERRPHLGTKVYHNRPLYFGVGMSVDSRDHFQDISDVMKEVFLPHIFVSIGHLSSPDDKLPDCRMRPLTVLEFPPGKRPSYGHTMYEAGQLLRHLAEQKLDVVPAVSISLQGRWYRPKGGAPVSSFKFYDSCEDTQRLFKMGPLRLNLTKNYERLIMLKELFAFTNEHVMTTEDIPKCHSFPLYQLYKKYDNP
ncbi:hypothetical protein HPB50_022188 [Hyalomma asiaticum]|uniref:Uncharacterized protein n=1 Tax=Hyalomma asiaticum TaxID=266040 RepID=A0ACB7RW11_HYAAI|nr:hypothetical protein HPB50_022188 [Hyalomma asiaticum]